MKIEKGKISNVSKKLLALGLTFALIPTAFAGCTEFDKYKTEFNKYKNFEYSENEQGEYQMSGTIGYHLFKESCFIVVENPSYDIEEYYLCRKEAVRFRTTVLYNRYYNIFNDQLIFNEYSEKERKMVYSVELENYLLAYGSIKSNYTKEDVELLFEQMKEMYLEEKNKQLVKE